MSVNSHNKVLPSGSFLNGNREINLITNHSLYHIFVSNLLYFHNIVPCLEEKMEMTVESYLIFSKVFLLVMNIIQINEYICTMRRTLMSLMSRAMIATLYEIDLNCQDA